ncbi:MAG: hypothetical protein KGN39_01760, partial [Betaproteobacteria bacterium]|nr:hypothetical protein [Betaproteobacteria bacterium]
MASSDIQMPAVLDQAGSPPEPAPVLNQAALASLGTKYASLFERYERERRLAELRWARNYRQFLGIYDPDIEMKLDANRSRAYPKLTRVKCVSMLARLMNLLFPESEKNWTVGPSPVPNLEQDDLQQVLDRLQQENPDPSDEAIEAAIRKFAAKQAARLELEIEDQLKELGGNKQANYVALCRQVLMSGIQYGMGVLKGPFSQVQKQRTWTRDEQGRLMAIPVDAERPRFEFVNLWDYYPDMSAKRRDQMDGQFERHVFSHHQVLLLKQRSDFMPDQIDKFLASVPDGNYKRRAYETELKAMGVQVNSSEGELHKYEAISWHGFVSGKDLAAAGVTVPEDKMEGDVLADLWLMGNIVVKAILDPWSQLETDGNMPMYHHFVFEEDESTIIGTGLPNIMRDSQMGLCAAVRMVIDNGSIVCGPQLEVNTNLLRMDQDLSSIQAYKLWYREDDSPTTAQMPAIRELKIDSHIPELQAIGNMFQGFADTETFVGPATGGDMQKGPSEPFRTAAGASMLRGDMALPFKDVVRQFDMFTESVIGAIIVFNRNFNADRSLRGDFQPIARGATSLIAKEVLGMQLDNLANTLTDDEKRYLNAYGLLKARVRARDMDVDDVVVDEEEASKRDQQAAQAQQDAQAQQTKLFEAEVRNVLAETLKAISQAQKNSANAEAVTANTILAALEKGVVPHEIVGQAAAAGAGAGPTAPNAPVPAGGGLPGGAG